MHVDLVPILKDIASVIVIPALVALVKSEMMALDKSTQASGLVHFYRLAKKALVVVPEEDIKAIKESAASQSSTLKEVMDEFTKSEVPPTPDKPAGDTSIRCT